jgi:hypothetical protein
VDEGLTLKVIGKRPWLAAKRSNLVCSLGVDRFILDGHVSTWSALHLLRRHGSEGQFKLIHQLSHTLRRPTVLPTLKTCNLGYQLSDRLIARGQHALECGDVVRKGASEHALF